MKTSVSSVGAGVGHQKAHGCAVLAREQPSGEATMR